MISSAWNKSNERAGAVLVRSLILRDAAEKT